MGGETRGPFAAAGSQGGFAVARRRVRCADSPGVTIRQHRPGGSRTRPRRWIAGLCLPRSVPSGPVHLLVSRGAGYLRHTPCEAVRETGQQRSQASGAGRVLPVCLGGTSWAVRGRGRGRRSPPRADAGCVYPAGRGYASRSSGSCGGISSRPAPYCRGWWPRPRTRASHDGHRRCRDGRRKRSSPRRGRSAVGAGPRWRVARSGHAISVGPGGHRRRR